MGERLDGTVALVTGASSGIGEATARALAGQGAKVAVAARRRDRLEALAGEIDCLVIEADISDRDQATAAVERTVGELGRLDTVVNNAGVMLLGEAQGAPLEEWERMVAINVLGVREEVRAASRDRFKDIERMAPEDIADVIEYIVTRPRRVALNEVLVRPTNQEG